ncbi:EthD family reductase [Rhodococcus baikonurensis]|uniref:EthD family reductase n=1 Tax=Rhodococcus erythropolis group TaxID=2840174 RepID=UPI000BB35564|nr:EthD family reductase [Rhodococcus erythropolis]PBI88070.1 EthD protein [Rhodococcus erythropolis]
MAMLVAVHRTPADPEAYNRHYFDVHVPLAKALPGLRRYEVSEGPVLDGDDETDIHLVAFLHFDNVDAARSALTGPEGKAAIADLPNLGADANISLLTFDTRENF